MYVRAAEGAGGVLELGSEPARDVLFLAEDYCFFGGKDERKRKRDGVVVVVVVVVVAVVVVVVVGGGRGAGGWGVDVADRAQ